MCPFLHTKGSHWQTLLLIFVFSTVWISSNKDFFLFLNMIFLLAAAFYFLLYRCWRPPPTSSSHECCCPMLSTSAEEWAAHLPTLSLCGWPLVQLLVSALCWKQSCELMRLWIFMNVDGDSRANLKVEVNFLWFNVKVWPVIYVLERKLFFLL